MDLAGTQTAGRKEQLAGMLLDGRSWTEVAIFSSGCCQCHALGLRPYQPPPCEMTDARPIDDFPLDGKVAAWELRRRLIGARLSPYEPDPLRALEQAEARRRGDLPAA